MKKASKLSAFAKNLKKLRQEKKLSQEDLGKIVGVSRGSISFYENDDRIPDMKVLRELKAFFDVDYDFLFGESPFRSKTEEVSVSESVTALHAAISNTNTAGTNEIIELLQLIVAGSKENEVDDIVIPAVTETLADILDILVAFAGKASDNPTAPIVHKYLMAALGQTLAGNGKQESQELTTAVNAWMKGFTYDVLPHCDSIKKSADSYTAALQARLFELVKVDADRVLTSTNKRLPKGAVNNG